MTTAIKLLDETPDTVTLSRLAFEALLDQLEEAEDRADVAEHYFDLLKAGGRPSYLTSDEAERLAAGESPVALWREKRGLTQRELADKAKISQSYLAEIERRVKTGGVDTLTGLAHVLEVEIDALVTEASDEAATPIPP